MANISVDTVYKTVLSILNKEQRGYLTPYEFNQLATQVQLEIFESYFENLNQQLRAGENASEYANRIKLLQEKIARFEVEQDITVAVVSGLGEGDLTSLTETVHRLGTVHSNVQQYLPVEIEQVTKHEFNLYIFDPVANGVSKNFEIDDTDQTEVILKILMYAGVIIRDQEIIQAAASKAMAKDQLQAT